VAAWQELIGGGSLLLEAIPVNGSRHRALSPLDLPWLIPDFPCSRLSHDGRVVYDEARVRRLPAPVKRWREHPPLANIERALANILLAKPTLAGEALENALCAQLGEGMTREAARAAIKQHAPQTIRRPGRPRKK
jgi:hypothetical protein